jgi:mRNA interferase RelE/StbE
MYEVILLAQAKRFFSQADRPLARKLVRGFAQLEAHPTQHPSIKPLSGVLAGWFRLRLGDYRVIYRVDSKIRTVFVDRIAHRREAYRD